MQHLFIVVSEQSKLEAVLCWVKCNCSGTRRTVQAVCRLPLDACKIDRIIECADYTIVALRGGHKVSTGVCGWNGDARHTLGEDNISCG